MIDEIFLGSRDIESLVQYGSNCVIEGNNASENFFHIQRKEMHSNHLQNDYIMSENRKENKSG